MGFTLIVATIAYAAIGIATIEAIAMFTAIVCVAAILNFTVLYDIDPTVEPLMRLIGITDEDIEQGYVYTIKIFDRDNYFKSIRTKLILEYVKSTSQSALDYILGYSNYGNNQFMITKNGISGYVKGIAEGVNEVYARIDKYEEILSDASINMNSEEYKKFSAVLSNLKNIIIKRLNNDADEHYVEENGTFLQKYEQQIIASVNGMSSNTVKASIISETGRIPTSIDYGYIKTPTNNEFGQYYLQETYGFDYNNLTTSINNEIYTYIDTTYDKTLLNLKITLAGSKGVRSYINTDDFSSKSYIVAKYSVNNNSFLYLKELEYDNKQDLYYYIDSNGNTIEINKNGNSKGYLNSFPVICYRHNGHNITEYKDIDSYLDDDTLTASEVTALTELNEILLDPLITKSYSKAVERILKGLGLSFDLLYSYVDDINNNLKDQSTNKDKSFIRDAFFVWGVPITAIKDEELRKLNKKDSKYDPNFIYQEPEVLSKVLFNIFNAVYRDVIVFDVNDKYESTNNTVSLTLKQRPYYGSFTWVPTPIETSMGILTDKFDKKVKYWHETSYLNYTSKSYLFVTISDAEYDSDNLLSACTFTYYSKTNIYDNSDNIVRESTSSITTETYQKEDTIILGWSSLGGEDGAGTIERVNAIKFFTNNYRINSIGESTQFLDTRTSTDADSASNDSKTIERVILKYQQTPTTIKTITLLSPTYFNLINSDDMGGKAIFVASPVTAFKYIDDSKIAKNDTIDCSRLSNVLLPVPVDVIKMLSLQEQTQLMALAGSLNYFVKEQIHLEWFETEKYADFVSTVSTCCSLCMAIASIVSLGASFATQPLMEIAKNVALHVGISLAFKAISTVVDDPLLSSALQLIGVIVNAGIGISGNEFTFNFDLSAFNVTQLSFASVDAVSTYINKTTENGIDKLNKDINKFNKEYEEIVDSMYDYTKNLNQSLLSTSDVLDLNFNNSYYAEPTMYLQSVNSFYKTALGEVTYQYDYLYNLSDMLEKTITENTKCTFNDED